MAQDSEHFPDITWKTDPKKKKRFTTFYCLIILVFGLLAIRGLFLIPGEFAERLALVGWISLICMLFSLPLLLNPSIAITLTQTELLWSPKGSLKLSDIDSVHIKDFRARRMPTQSFLLIKPTPEYLSLNPRGFIRAPNIMISLDPHFDTSSKDEILRTIRRYLIAHRTSRRG